MTFHPGESYRGGLRQRWDIDSGKRVQWLTLLELLQNFLKAFFELRLIFSDLTFFLLPILPLVVILLRELHPQRIKVLFHLEQVTKRSFSLCNCCLIALDLCIDIYIKSDILTCTSFSQVSI